MDMVLVYLVAVLISYILIGNKLFSSFSYLFTNTIFGFYVGYPLWKGNQVIGWLSGRIYPWRLKPKLTMTVALAGSFGYSVIIIILVHYLVHRLAYDTNIFDDFAKFVPQLFFVLLISMLITIAFYVSYFFKWWRILVVNEAKLEQEAIQLRYNALKSQVNPHFLFNSLSVLSSLVDTDTQKAKLFIQQFSSIYRYVLEQREKELAPLAEEVNFIRSFTSLHHVRHGENLQVSIEVDDNSGYIIPLSLQILLENCFKHNVISEEKPLNVRVWRENDYIVVQNNLQKRKAIHESGGVGLDTIRKQFEFLTKRAMQIEHNDKYFTVRIPILKRIMETNSL